MDIFASSARFCGINLVISAQVIGVGLTVIRGLILLNAAFEQGGLCLGWIVGLLYATCAPFAVRSIGGLEQPLLMFLLAWGLVGVADFIVDGAHERHALYYLSIPFVLLSWVRPDCPLFSVVVGCFVMVFVAGKTVASAVAVVVVLGVVAYIVYFGSACI